MSKKSKKKNDVVHSAERKVLKENSKKSESKGLSEEVRMEKNLQESVREIMDEDSGKKKKSKLKPEIKKRILIIGGSGAGCLLLVYFGLAFFFQSHFVFGTEINGVPCAGKTVEQAEKEILDQVDNYEMHITGKDDFEAVISGQDIDLMVVFDGELEKVKETQNSFGWIASLFGRREKTVGSAVHFNDESLTEQFEALTCLDNPDAVEPVSATLTYKNGSFEIVPEQEGTVVSKDDFREALWDSINNLENEFSMEEKKCYKQPDISSDSEELLKAQETMNGYLDVKITYSFGDSKEVVDGDEISGWIHMNEKAEVLFDEEAVRAYINTLGDKYNTCGKKRSFQTSYDNKTVEVTQGDYGWRMNRVDETLALIEDIKAGESKEKEPIYLSRAAQYGENDIGGTYVEINLTAQHVFFYKDGKLKVDSDCVTGTVSKGQDTPEGIYGITYKDYEAILRGPGYASPVTYWMPFNGNVGLHDAPWRNGIFGGNDYLTNGSRGCVNLPFAVAETIFKNVEAGTPVIVYSLAGTESWSQDIQSNEEQETAPEEFETTVPDYTYPTTTTTTTTTRKATTTKTTTTTRKTTTTKTTTTTTTSSSLKDSSEMEPSPSEQSEERSYQMTKAATRTELERQKKAE